MNVIQSVKNYVSSALDFNQATLSGAIDIIAVKDEEGMIKCTPFHVRFGKLQLLKSREKKVEIYLNGKLVEGLSMKLGAAGEAFFVEKVNQPVDEDYLTSPISSPTMSPQSCEQAKIAAIDMEQLSLDEVAEFRDTYRVVADSEGVSMKAPPSPKPNVEEGDALNDNETQGWWSWGWGSLPVVRTSPLDSGDLEELEYPIHISEQPSSTVVRQLHISHQQGERNLTSTSYNEDSWVGSLFGMFRRRNGLEPSVGESSGLPPSRNPSVYFDAIDIESDGDDHQGGSIPLMSLCAQLLSEADGEAEAETIFHNNIVSYEDFVENPMILDDPNLLFMIKGRLFPWMVAGPYLVSAVLYGRPLDGRKLDILMDKMHGNIHQWTQSSWFGWLRPIAEKQESNAHIDSERILSDQTIACPSEVSTHTFPTVSHPRSSLDSWLDSDVTSEFYSKSLRPTQEQLQKLDLKEGANSIEFIVRSSLQGERTVSAVLYLWDPNSKIVVSDVDGTISRSNVLGQLMPMVGRDWSYDGVASLYASIVKNGYQIVYLTSRAIGQTGVTKGYLDRVVQDDVSLPKGPVLLSPDRLIESFSRVRTRRSEEFKVAALSGIRMLFPKDWNPLYAGFGNTHCDMMSYKKVGIPEGKIFIMDSNGELRNWTGSYRKSYISMVEHVDGMFPPIADCKHSWSSRNYVDEVFNEHNFWKIPPPVLD